MYHMYQYLVNLYMLCTAPFLPRVQNTSITWKNMSIQVNIVNSKGKKKGKYAKMLQSLF